MSSDYGWFTLSCGLKCSGKETINRYKTGSYSASLGEGDLQWNIYMEGTFSL